jgi:hypothetical protein
LRDKAAKNSSHILTEDEKTNGVAERAQLNAIHALVMYLSERADATLFSWARIIATDVSLRIGSKDSRARWQCSTRPMRNEPQK